MTVGDSIVGMRRLVQLGVAQPHFTHTGEIAAWLGAVQGQDFLGTKWAFGRRLPGSTEADIDRALADRQIIRIWGLRGTLHYVAPEDVHWIVALIAPRLIAGNALRYRQLELDEPTLIRSTQIIAAALGAEGQLTRGELFIRLQAEGISTAGQRGVYMLQRAGLERLIVQGEMRGAETTFHALDEGKTLPKEEALAELARRYFTSHSPTTLADFTAWAGLTVGEARTGFHAVKSELIEERIDGQDYWITPNLTAQPSPSLVMLPGFDEFVLGYRDRTAVLEPAFADAICPGGNGMFSPTIVRNGRIIGTWKRTVKKKAVVLDYQTFYPLSASDQAALADAANAYGAFLGLPAVLQEITR
ncbi:MAG: winged helix DNA-binding domain-containing protein [Anaerolineae bacterium]